MGRQNTPMENRKMAATRLNPKETAKVIRTVLKKAFPETTFRVTTGRGAGVSSVDLSWMDGPTTKEVDAIVGAFEMGRFNGMTDSYDYDKTEDRQLLVDGVHYEAGCRYVMTQRRCSAVLARKAVAQLVEYWGGVEYIPEIIEQTSGGWWFANSSDSFKPVREDLAKGGVHYDWQSQIHQALSDPSRFVREVVAPAKPATPYTTEIARLLAVLGVGSADPILVEAWMRVEHSTLDGLSKSEFAAEVKAAWESLVLRWRSRFAQARAVIRAGALDDL
jgi:hypothetical protein